MTNGLNTTMRVPGHNPDCEHCLQRGLDLAATGNAVKELTVEILKVKSDVLEVIRRLDSMNALLIEGRGMAKLAKVLWVLFGTGMMTGLGLMVRHVFGL